MLKGGNAARHLGLDVNVVKETSTLYTPTFRLNIGREDPGITTPSGQIKDFTKYAGADSMMLATGKESLAARLLFATNRPSLPALWFTDDYAVNFSDILAERFNRCCWLNQEILQST